MVGVIRLSRASYRKMVQNLVWAAGYNVAALPLAAGVLAWAGILLSPAVGAILMSGSTIVVAANAQLLRRLNLRPAPAEEPAAGGDAGPSAPPLCRSTQALRMLRGVQTPDGWYPDPTGRHQLRRWESGTWADWVSTGGQVGNDPMPPPPSSGGGTLTTEPVVHAVLVGGRWSLTTVYGQPLATAIVSGRVVTVSDAAGAPTHQLRRSVAGSTNVVSLVGRDDREVGRFEEVRRAYLGGFRVVGLGALLATLDAQTNDLRRLVLVDPGGRPLGRVADDDGRWTTELAHPLGPPLGELAALACLAVNLAWH